MLETIFTGHTIRMADLMAIGPIQEHQQVVSAVLGRRSLVLEVHLRHCKPLTHTALTQELFGGVQPYQNEEWNQAFDKLVEERRALLDQWANTLYREKEVSHG